MCNRVITFVLLFLLNAITVVSQNSLTGTIQDFDTGERLQYANISLLNSPVGTMTNENGEFVLYLNKTNLKDTLLISFLGYSNLKIPVDSAFFKQNVFRLKKSIEFINEVTVKPIDPFELLQNALLKKSYLYNVNAYNSEGFYREIMLENNEPVKLAEAACLFYISPYASKFNRNDAIWNYLDFSAYNSNYRYDQALNYSTNATYPDDAVQIISARSSDDFTGSISKFCIAGGPLNITATDFFRNETFYFSSSGLKTLKNKKKFTYHIDFSIYDGKNVYDLNFVSKQNSDWLRVIVERESGAIISYSGKYTLNNSSQMERTGQIKGQKKTVNDIVTEKELNFRVDFKNIKGLWYLNHIKSINTYEYKYLLEDITVQMAYDRELVFNNYNTEGVKKIADNLAYKNIISNSLYDYPTSYDKDFWNNYNMLYPTELQTEILNKIEATKSLEDQYQSKFISFDEMEKPFALNVIDTSYIHNDTIVDTYAWTKNNSELLDYIEKENKYVLSYLYENNSLIKGIYNELKSYELKHKYEFSFDTINSYYYFFSLEGNFCRSSSPDTSANEVVINLVEKTIQNSQYALYDYSFNEDAGVLTYIESPDGGRNLNLICINIENLGKICELKNVMQLEWIDNNRFLYTSLDDNDFFPTQVYLHDIKSNVDSLIYKEVDERKKLSLKRSASNKFIFIESFSFSDNYSTLAINTENENCSIVAFKNIPDSVYAKFDHYNNKFYIRTNYSKPNFSIMVLPENEHDIKKAENIFSFLSDTTITELNFNAGKLLLSFQHGITTDFGIVDEATLSFKHLKWKENNYTVSFCKNISETKTELSFESYLEPPQKWIYDIPNDIISQTKHTEIRGYNKNKYEVKIANAKHSDGITIPIVMVGMKKGKKTRPMLMEVYAAGMGKSLLPGFRSDIFPLLDRGFIYAYPLVRGSGELGYEWYKKGAKQNKTKTFEDVAVCAKWVQENKLTTYNTLFYTAPVLEDIQ
ncbi:MAG TPA: carboxypeptidase-like regulatory domain-containing protein [Bacteroidales bacterium]|jgi:oligopeptidase B|nr:carboxypeptidase-like regulatory domain-containing protein [Bacteroidales bacterium]